MSLQDAVDDCDVELLKDRIANGGDLDWADEDGRTALYHAAVRSDVECVTVLLEARADVNKSDMSDAGGWTPLHRASLHGHLACVKVELFFSFFPAYLRASALDCTQSQCRSPR